jgi:hypothetical protein
MPEGWIVMPDEVDAQVARWHREHSEFLEIDCVTQYVGRKAYALTVTDKRVPAERRRKHLFAVPHAHEPAATAACTNFVHQLLAGRNLDGSPSRLDRDAILRGTILTFIADANPGGRARAPVRFWDGSRYTNDEFGQWMFGIDAASGGMFKRVGKWSDLEDHPTRVGIVYEQISAHEYVEPNRSQESSYSRLIRLVRAKHRYDQCLDLHQTEFEGDAEHDCMVVLPVINDELPASIRDWNRAWGEEVVAAWREAGGHPIPEVKPLGYTGEQREYFVRNWSGLYRELPTITSEVQNNSPRTPPAKQRLLSETAIRVSIERLLG